MKPAEQIAKLRQENELLQREIVRLTAERDAAQNVLITIEEGALEGRTLTLRERRDLPPITGATAERPKLAALSGMVTAGEAIACCKAGAILRAYRQVKGETK